MRKLQRSFLIGILSALAAMAAPAQENDGKPDKKRQPKFTVGKDTTYVTEPVDKDGYIDYAAALNERLSKGVTPKNNAYVLITKAIGPKPEGAPLPAEFYKLLGIAEPPENGDYFIGLDRFIKDHLNIDDQEQAEEIRDQMTRATQRAWTAQQYPHVAAWLKANEKPLAVVVEATRRSRYFHPLVPGKSEKGPSGLIGALVPGVQKCRELTSSLAARAMLHLDDDRADDTWQDLLACHRLGRHVAHGGTLIESLVGIAIEQIAAAGDLGYLERARLSSNQIMERLRELQQLPPMLSIADTFDFSERFIFLDVVMMLNRGGPDFVEQLALGASLAGQIAGKPPTANVLTKAYFESIDWDPVMRTAHGWFDRSVAALRIPNRAQREKAVDDIIVEIKVLKSEMTKPGNVIRLAIGDAKTKGKLLGDHLMALLMPAVHKVQQAADRTEQVQSNLHVAFALAAYQRDHGRYPDKLDALAPKYLPQIPNDLFTGKPLIYRPMAQGYLLYSFGSNGRDDEGHWYDDDPPGDDPNVRMPLPRLREKK
jgi:hypothetical protein